MEEPSRTTVHNQPEKNNKTSLKMKIDRPRGGGGGGGGGAISVGIIILGGAVAAAAFLFNQRRRKSGSSSNGKKGSSQPAKVIQDKYINEDKGLQFVATSSSASSDKDQDHDHHQRNETSSNGVHDQKQDCNTMISDEAGFFKQDEKGKGKLEVNGKNEDILSISPQVLDHIRQLDPPSREREFQMTIPDAGKTLLQLTTPENESTTQEIACVKEENLNSQDMQVNIGGEETKVNSWESNEGITSNGDLLPHISEIEEEVSFQPMTANISMSNGCVENAPEIQAAVKANNGKDEELNAANEEQGKGGEDIPCTKSSSGNEDNEEHQTHFRDHGNGIKSEALEATDKFQIPEEEENLKPLPISEALGVAEMNGEQIQETREKDKLPDVDHPEPHMDTIETSLKDFQDGDSAIYEPTSMQNNVNAPEFGADNVFKAIQQSAEIGGLEKKNVESEIGNEDRVVEIEDSQIQLDDEDMIALKEVEDAVTTEEQRLTMPEEDDHNDMDESSASEKVEESSEETADSSAESNAEPNAEAIQCLPTELEKPEANYSKEIVELPNEEEKEEKLADIATQETRLQNSKDEKGNVKLTALEKCMMQLGELALEATHPHKRRMLILTIMASSGSLCLYLGMDFLQLCLIFILSMMLFEMQGI